jgi:O-acetyl-ADP-ribose deacetylase (regulator of RNase III)
MSLHLPQIGPDLVYNLVIVLAIFAVFAWCVRRGILNAKEVVWIGTAMGFFATSLIFNAVLRANRPIYGLNSPASLLGITALMTVPLVVALTYGIFALYRSLIEKELAVVQVDGMTLRLVLGNIAALKTETPLDALVNPANTDLKMGAGVAGALKSFGGSDIDREARAQAPIAVGQAVATGAGRLKARYIIHAAVMGRDRKTDPDKIKRALEGTFKCARKIGARRIALPAFGTGIGNAPAKVVAPMTIQAVLRARKDFDEVVIVVFNGRIAPFFQAEFKKLGADASSPAPVAVRRSRNIF